MTLEREHQRIKQYVNYGNILQCPSSQQNLKHFFVLMKLKCNNDHHIISDTHVHFKFINSIKIKILKKLKTNHTAQGS